MTSLVRLSVLKTKKLQGGVGKEKDSFALESFNYLSRRIPTERTQQMTQSQNLPASEACLGRD